MGMPSERKKAKPPWNKSPVDLRDPKVFEALKWQLVTIFGPNGSRIPYFKQVCKTMLKLKVWASSNLSKVVFYASYLHKLQAKWMLESLAQWHCQQQEPGMLKFEEAMSIVICHTVS
ncbi:developmental pluripotency-associated 5 protein-like [Echinops telfairi]|uniref:Developmental pluripotency-associated 5 protein-like n=1 Tax=Echinops telfairi TaxID=9371 RepID=A0ABM0IIJ2_ECHTE|nr:developmental pluripotency-associated 5 protein-like [Echinops telfairi]